MKVQFEKVLGEVGVSVLFYLELSEILNSLAYASKFIEMVTECSCKLRLKELNYTWIRDSYFGVDGTLMSRGYYRRLLGLVTRKGAIIVGGNMDSRRCKFFSPRTLKFTTMNYMSMKGETTNSTAVWHRGRIFVFSCNIESATGSLEVYNPIVEAWSRAATGLPIIIKSSAAASCANILYIVGGDHYCKPHWKKSDRIFVLSNEDGEKDQQFQWTKLGVSLLRGRMFHAAASFHGKIWIAGGLLEKRVGDSFNDLCTRSVEIFDPRTYTVVQGPNMIHTRFQSTLAVVKGSLYIIGGDVHQTERTVGTIEKFNEDMNEWEMITTFPKRRESCAICAIDQLIYIFGGCMGCKNFNDWDAYNVDTNKWLSDNDDIPDNNLMSSCIHQHNTLLTDSSTDSVNGINGSVNSINYSVNSINNSVNSINNSVSSINNDNQGFVINKMINTTNINTNINTNIVPDMIANIITINNANMNININMNTNININININNSMNKYDNPHNVRLLFPIVSDSSRNSMSMLNGATAVTSSNP